MCVHSRRCRWVGVGGGTRVADSCRSGAKSHAAATNRQWKPLTCARSIAVRAVTHTSPLLQGCCVIQSIVVMPSCRTSDLNATGVLFGALEHSGSPPIHRASPGAFRGGRACASPRQRSYAPVEKKLRQATPLPLTGRRLSLSVQLGTHQRTRTRPHAAGIVRRPDHPQRTSARMQTGDTEHYRNRQCGRLVSACMRCGSHRSHGKASTVGCHRSA